MKPTRADRARGRHGLIPGIVGCAVASLAACGGSSNRSPTAATHPPSLAVLVPQQIPGFFRYTTSNDSVSDPRLGPAFVNGYHAQWAALRPSYPGVPANISVTVYQYAAPSAAAGAMAQLESAPNGGGPIVTQITVPSGAVPPATTFAVPVPGAVGNDHDGGDYSIVFTYQAYLVEVDGWPGSGATVSVDLMNTLASEEYQILSSGGPTPSPTHAT